MDLKIKDIKGFEGLYAITDDGRVWSYPKAGGRKLGLWIGIFPQRRGYLNCTLFKKYKRKTFLIHQLVANAFIPNPDNLKEINHIDGNKHNNNVSNLEWSDRKLNMKHAYKLGLLHDLGNGENHSQSKLKEYEVKEIRDLYSTNNFSQRYLAKKFDVNQRLIWSIIHGEIWKNVY